MNMSKWTIIILYALCIILLSYIIIDSLTISPDVVDMATKQSTSWGDIKKLY